MKKEKKKFIWHKDIWLLRCIIIVTKDFSKALGSIFLWAVALFLVSYILFYASYNEKAAVLLIYILASLSYISQLNY